MFGKAKHSQTAIDTIEKYKWPGIKDHAAWVERLKDRKRAAANFQMMAERLHEGEGLELVFGLVGEYMDELHEDYRQKLVFFGMCHILGVEVPYHWDELK